MAKARAKDTTPERTTTTLKGGLTTKERLWAHRVIDQKVAAERALGTPNRAPGER